MNRRGGKREGASRKKSPALAKITREINQKHRKANHQYIYLENRVFLTWWKVRAEEIFVNDSNFASWQMAVPFVARNKDVNSDQKEMFWISLDLFCGMNDMKVAWPSKRARLTVEGPLCSWRVNYHVLFNTFTLSCPHVLCHNYCQVHQLPLHWENAEMFPIFRL